MFFKKLLYKITNPEKYEDYKVNVSIEKKKKLFRWGIRD